MITLGTYLQDIFKDLKISIYFDIGHYNGQAQFLVYQLNSDKCVQYTSNQPVKNRWDFNLNLYLKNNSSKSENIDTLTQKIRQKYREKTGKMLTIIATTYEKDTQYWHCILQGYADYNC